MKGVEKSAVLNTEHDADLLYQYKVKIEKIKDHLLDFGLTPNQAKVYIHLGKFGPKTAPDIFKTLNLPRSEAYFILNALQNRGIIMAECISPVRYTAVTLKKAISMLVNTEQEKLKILAIQEKELCELWEEISPYVIEPTETTNKKLQMLQGSSSIFAKILSIITTAKQEILIFGTEKDLSRFYHSEIVDIFINSASKSRVIICPAQKIPEFANNIDKKMIRLMPNAKNDNQCYVVIDNKETVIFLRNAKHPLYNMFAIWSDSNSLIESMNNLFNYYWNNAEQCS
ncbi:MAG: TrmB family transcriptional regulator [Thaumarchaeota archaeon]|nr:TrmB family transcriptional regulator [Nitrososphaerota archaeon]MBI3639164.1 TrmB family transcriptional regulator [Nitrososphaerota archaeon]